MGINYPACKAHGNAEAKELASALRMLYDAVKLKLVAMIKNEF
jgi:fatty acid/phospholipid biosynthesis enzyme